MENVLKECIEAIIFAGAPGVSLSLLFERVPEQATLPPCTPLLCDSCNSHATSFCSTCSQAFCEICHRVHATNETFSDHQFRAVKIFELTEMHHVFCALVKHPDVMCYQPKYN